MCKNNILIQWVWHVSLPSVPVGLKVPSVVLGVFSHLKSKYHRHYSGEYIFLVHSVFPTLIVVYMYIFNFFFTLSLSLPFTEEKKGIRKSTQLKSAETVKRQRERAEVERKRAMSKRDRAPSLPRLTQEELLEEAKITEEINLKSLG